MSIFCGNNKIINRIYFCFKTEIEIIEKNSIQFEIHRLNNFNSKKKRGKI